MEQVLRSAAEVLRSAGVEAARVDAELLLAHLLGTTRGALQAMALTGVHMPDPIRQPFADLVRRRQAREPLQHLTGRAPFRTLELAVGPGVFVPRPETEVVAQHAIDALRRVRGRRRDARRPAAVDLGTGSGAIALALAAEVPGAEIVGIERSPAAYEWAVRNAESIALPNVRILLADLADALPELRGAVDVVVSNPPYVPEDMVPRDPEVRLHDPAVALYGGPDGLDPMRAVIATARRLLRSGGTLVVEHGEAQGQQVRSLLDAVDWRDAATHPDLTGRDRLTTAERR
ncbi:peptide chain release factor N(5)-glutamine methyltransferase [uncultured Amnibacterium sp.]|uniref:peptide chain release factor N(5)-glutamine methyltransferase n=1 Tax=uncultured Amnibacterium sp. TaxID=1631851 RepID=UPI0035CB6971